MVITAVLVVLLWAALYLPVLPPSGREGPQPTPEPKSLEEMERSYPDFYAEPSAEPAPPEAPKTARRVND